MIDRSRARIRRAISALLLLPAMFLMVGCTGWLEFGYGEGEANKRKLEAIREEQSQQISDLKKLEEYKQVDTDQTLPTGHVLSVRVHWGADTDATVCTVRIENPRNGWYDYIEFATTGSSLASGGKSYEDYWFTAENFNHQLEERYPDQKDITGMYDLYVTANNGAQDHLEIYWDAEKNVFEPNILNIPL